MTAGPSYNTVVVHYHEIGLKGGNREFFERKLVDNIRTVISGTNYERVRRLPGRVLVELRETSELKTILEKLRCTFGISSFAPAIATGADMKSLVDTSLALARSVEFESFQVRARKGHSSFAESSQRVNEVVGQSIKDTTGRRVDLSSGEWTCHIELVLDGAFVYWDRIEGPGGLPVGTSGRVLTLLSGGIDSPVAAWEVAKRGAEAEMIHFHGQPYTDPSSVRQATRLVTQLAPWVITPKLWLVPFGEIQAEIVTSAPQELRVVLYRRFMMRIAEALALREGLPAIVTGESLGQVASQTLPNIAIIDSVVRHLPVFRPLIGRDKVEIERIARNIGTYDVSIDPHQDCCVLFVPRKVTTRADSAQIDAAEVGLDVEALVERGLSGAEPAELEL